MKNTHNFKSIGLILKSIEVVISQSQHLFNVCPVNRFVIELPENCCCCMCGGINIVKWMQYIDSIGKSMIWKSNSRPTEKSLFSAWLSSGNYRLLNGNCYIFYNLAGGLLIWKHLKYCKYVHIEVQHAANYILCVSHVWIVFKSVWCVVVFSA